MNELLVLIIGELRAAWRFRWLAVSFAWVVCIVGWLFVFSLPDRYESRATVYVDTTSTLRPLLEQLTVSPDVLRQVDVVTQVMKGRPQLEKVARETGLYLRAGSPEQMENLLLTMTRDVVIAANKNRGSNLYEISFTDYDPKMAQTVVATLLDFFVEDSLGANRQGTQQAQQFIREQLTALELELTDAEKQLADFKKENVGRMPGDTGDYFARLQSEMNTLENLDAELNLAEKRRKALRDQLSGERPTLEAGGALQSDLDTRIAENRKRLEDLQLRFTDLHPDVIALTRTLEQLEEQKRQQLEDFANSDGTGVVSDNPVFQNIQIELSNVDVEIATLRERRAVSSRKVNELNSLVDILPEIEAELTRLTRDYDVKQSQYQALLRRLEVAELSESAEESDNIKFRIIDPPILPTDPSEPNRTLLLAGVMFLGLATAAGVAVLGNQVSPVFNDVRQLQKTIGLPVLGIVATMKTRDRRLQRAGEISSISMSFGVLLVVFALVLLLQDTATRIVQSLISGLV